MADQAQDRPRDRAALVFRWLQVLAIVGTLAVLAHGFVLDLHFSNTPRTRYEQAVASMLGTVALFSFVVLMGGYSAARATRNITPRKVSAVVSLVVLAVAEAEALRRLADTPV